MSLFISQSGAVSIMAVPKVVIVGRANVGKSSLFNALAGSPISIVEPTAGVTRDRVGVIIERDGKFFELIDTGGYGIVDSDQLSEQIERQILMAIESADLVLFMVDIKEGLTPLDEGIARMLRKENPKVLGVAGKADTAKLFPSAGEFATLGFGDFLPVSAANNMNKNELVDGIFQRLGDLVSADKPEEPVMKIAIVGRRNAGKSTLVNAIVGQDRVIVSEVPGTTRDAVDVRFERGGQTIVVIDTAGVRKRPKSLSSIDFYSYVRATRSIHRCDVAMLMIDATAEVSEVDKKLAALISEEYRSCIIVVNKWDLARQRAVTGDYEEYLTKGLAALKNAPIAFTVAKDGKNVERLLDLAEQLYQQSMTWITTPKLNQAFEKICAEKSGGSKTGFPKIYYGVQIAVNPVTILMFVNRPQLFEENYRKFIVNRLQSLLPVGEVPIRLMVRSHRGEKGKGSGDSV